MLDKGAGSLRAVSGRAMAIGLGGSAVGFLLNSAQKYMELSRVMTVVGRRFRETGKEAGFFGTQVLGAGTAMGFTVAESGRLVETLGAQTNVIREAEFKRYAGFARERGIDPGQTLGGFGRMSHMLGGELTDKQLARIAVRSDEQDMGAGRQEEFVQSLTHLAEMQFEAVGAGDYSDLMATQAIPGMVFGAHDPRGEGQRGVQFTQGLNSVLTGSGPMRSFMLRAMGYGKEGGPGYIEARKRLDAGVFDPENVEDLFSAFQERGMGEGAQFRAIESVAGGRLKAHQIEALVQKMGTEEGLEAFSAEAQPGAFDMGEYLSTLTGEEQAKFTQTAGAGFADLGTSPGRISMGEGMAQLIEGMQLAVGAPVAQGIMDLKEAIVALAGTAGNLAGVDLGTMLTDLTGAIEQVAASLQTVTTGAKTIPEMVQDGLDIAGQIHDVLSTPFNPYEWWRAPAAPAAPAALGGAAPAGSGD